MMNYISTGLLNPKKSPKLQVLKMNHVNLDKRSTIGWDFWGFQFEKAQVFLLL